MSSIGNALANTVGNTVGQANLGQCLVCERWPSRSLCGDCSTAFTPATPRCDQCALPLPPGLLQPGLAGRCASCVKSPAPLNRCWAAVDYAFPWDGLVQQLKYRRQPGLAQVLAPLWLQNGLGHELNEYIGSTKTWLLPIPMSPQRLQQRGYNQSLLLADALRSHLPRLRSAPGHWLLRNPSTDNLGLQAKNTRDERQKRMRHAFVVPPDSRSMINGQHLLLLDDVMTTGATLFAAARVLREAGAADVSALCWARTAAQ